jgi:TPR repeat protein
LSKHRVYIETAASNSQAKLINYQNASRLLHIAIQSNIPEALHSLAVLYEYGYGVRQDYTKASLYYTMAGEQGYTDSMYHLGLMHAFGRGKSQDFASALTLFETAARLNHPGATYYMV